MDMDITIMITTMTITTTAYEKGLWSCKYSTLSPWLLIRVINIIYVAMATQHVTGCFKRSYTLLCFACRVRVEKQTLLGVALATLAVIIVRVYKGATKVTKFDLGKSSMMSVLLLVPNMYSEYLGI